MCEVTNTVTTTKTYTTTSTPAVAAAKLTNNTRMICCDGTNGGYDTLKVPSPLSTTVAVIGLNALRTDFTITLHAAFLTA
jgi:hypothetical protein